MIFSSSFPTAGRHRSVPGYLPGVPLDVFSQGWLPGFGRQQVVATLPVVSDSSERLRAISLLSICKSRRRRNDQGTTSSCETVQTSRSRSCH